MAPAFQLWQDMEETVSRMEICVQRCTVALASNPGFPFRILSRSFGEKSRDKIRNGKRGFEATVAQYMSLLRLVERGKCFWMEVRVQRCTVAHYMLC